MRDSKTLTAEEVNRLFDELPDLLEREGGGHPIDARMPDGTYWVYDDALQATIEVAPDEKRYIVKYQKGKGLVRIKDLSVSAAWRMDAERRAAYVGPPKLTVLTSPNGSGKSTFLLVT